jgi:predicted small metal-binding protein
VAYDILYIADLVDFQILGVYSSILAINHVTLCEINIDISYFPLIVMVKAVCSDYGFDCDFICEGELDTVIDNFGKHCTEEHGIEYEKETLTKYLINK